jgi:hypothetical protein
MRKKVSAGKIFTAIVAALGAYKCSTVVTGPSQDGTVKPWEVRWELIPFDWAASCSVVSSDSGELQDGETILRVSPSALCQVVPDDQPSLGVRRGP